jgi:hypothetical protein
MKAILRIKYKLLAVFLQLSLLPALAVAPPPFHAAAGSMFACLVEGDGDGCGQAHKQAALLLPDLQTLPPTDLRLLIDPDGGRMMIRFSNSVVNLGSGPLEFRGALDRLTGVVRVSQAIYRTDSTSIERPMGELIFHDEHDHWHWENFSTYEVWTVTPDGALDALIFSSGKVSYCLRDDAQAPADLTQDYPLSARNAPSKAVYRGCGWNRQGISAGWTDIYKADIPGQYVVIPVAGDGMYALKSTVDPQNLLVEADKTNNSVVIFIAIQNNRLKVIDRLAPSK